MTKTFKEIINGIRTAILGIEVREDIAQGMEYVEQFADTSTTKAQEAANSAAAAEQAKTDTIAAKTEAVQAIGTEKQAGLDAISTAKSDAVKETQDAHTAALQDISDARAGALYDVAASTETATTAASTATKKAGEASASAAAAAESQQAAADSAAAAGKGQTAAETAQAKAEAAAALAGTRAGTDKTLAVENAPADAAATGEALAKKADKDVTLDADGNVLFYSKSKVDELLAKKLNLTGGTMSGTVFGDLSTDVNPFDIIKTVEGDCLIRFRNTATGADVGIGIGGLGKGVGIFDIKNSQWIINGVLDSKDIFIGSTFVKGFVVASGSNYVRFGDGTQICWGISAINGIISDTNVRVTYPMPFNEIPRVFAATNANINSSIPISVGWETTTSFSIGTGTAGYAGSTGWLAIGRWK